MNDIDALQADIDRLREAFGRLRESVGRTFLGQDDVSELLLLGLLAGGHVLLEGAPGLGKTTLVRGLASSLDLDFARVQFTPDLMPADVLGTRMLELDDAGGRHFAFEPGPVFTNVLLADEINRATPRTQAALLEAMEERQVTVFGETRALEEPFLVVATENPIEMEGTYPLPEAQLDRFLFKVTLEMPPQEELEHILAETTSPRVAHEASAVSKDDVVAMRALVRQVPASSEIVHFVSALILATHPGNQHAPERVRTLVRYGSSPRGGQALLLASKVRALVAGRLHVTVEDIEALAPPALRHRVLLGYEGEASGVSIDAIVADALEAARKV
ncbi:MAG: AAA domain-containing protein [bacterium]|nr:AAA domain-containing protein [bacterium]